MQVLLQSCPKPLAIARKLGDDEDGRDSIDEGFVCPSKKKTLNLPSIAVD